MNKTKTVAICLVILTALSLFAAVSKLAQAAVPITPKLDEYLNAAAKQGFTGSALVARGGKVIFSKGYGMANAEWDIPNTAQTKFRLGSITKQFTAASILLLQERGKLSVQDPVCKYVAECPKAWEPVTIHHLLVHTSGIPSYTDVKSPEEFRKMSLTQVTPAGFVDSFKSKPLEFPVGDMTVPYAAGSLYSTVEDLFAWNEALFSDKLISAKSREAMMTADKNNYAYGLVVNQQHNRKMVSHGGGINGFNTIPARFPEEKITVVVLRNADYGILGPGKISNDLAAILLGEKYEIPRERVAVKVDPKIFDAYVGEYELAPNRVFIVGKEGDKLMAAPKGRPQAELFPESETKFFLKIVDAQVTFVKDDKGAVTHLILHQGGDQKAKKIK